MAQFRVVSSPDQERHRVLSHGKLDHISVMECGRVIRERERVLRSRAQPVQVCGNYHSQTTCCSFQGLHPGPYLGGIITRKVEICARVELGAV